MIRDLFAVLGVVTLSVVLPFVFAVSLPSLRDLLTAWRRALPRCRVVRG